MILKLEKDKRSMLEKIGSPKNSLRKSDISSSSAIDSKDLEEESTDSLRVRHAKNQIHWLGNDLKMGKGKDKKIEKKKNTAKKLLDEKEKAIEEGIKEKLRDIETDHVD